MFAAEFGWTPDTVWELEYGHFVSFTGYFDELIDQRKKEARG
jgi:hypothetical protein